MRCMWNSKGNSQQEVKTTNVKATRPGERLFVDTTGPFPDVAQKNKYLFGGVDDFSGKMFMMFGTNKSQLVKFVDEAFTRFKAVDKPIKYIRMDGGGENEAVKDLCHKYGAEVEQTPPHTPSLNGRIERRFAVLISMAMALIWNAGFQKKIKGKLLGEAVRTASFLHDMAPTMRSKISAEELWHGKKNGWLPKHLKEFGRVGIVTILDKKVNKMQEKGKPMVMVGYAKESPAGTYRMWNHVTNRIVSTDNVKWSNFASWEIKEEQKLSKIFEAAKAANQEGLETFDEMDMEHAMDSQGIAQIEPIANAPEYTEQVEQAEPAQPAPILRRSTWIAELVEKTG